MNTLNGESVMEPETRLTKRALMRDHKGLHIQCCGNRVPQAMPPLISGTVCPTCGSVYDVAGWIVGNAHGKGVSVGVSVGVSDGRSGP